MHDLIARNVPPTVDHFARHALDALATDSGRDLLPLLSPTLVAQAGTSDSLRNLSRNMPPEGRDTASIVGYTKWVSTRGPITWRLIYSYAAGPKHVLCQVDLLALNGQSLQVSGIRVNVSDSSAASQNELTLHQASPAALVASLLAVANVGFCLWTAALVIRSRIPKRWLWALLACIGFARVGVSWHSGALAEQFIAIQFLGATLRRDGMIGPWWIYFSFPGGALLALQRLRKKGTPAPSVADAPPTPST
jgi:hypothetical protein